MPMSQHFLRPSPESGQSFAQAFANGPFAMLYLLRFHEWADYSADQHLAPEHPISGREAYERFVNHAEPFLKAAGGETIFMGDAAHFLIGPPDEQWDAVMILRQPSVQSFFDYNRSPEFLAGVGHRTAAVDDVRVLPISEIAF